MFSDTAKKQYRELIKPGNKFYNLNVVKEIFPEASICELEFSGTDEKKEKLLLMEFIEQYVSESLMLLGDGGIGKTTMLFHILESYNNGSAKFPQVPLYVELNSCPSDLESWCLDDKNSIFIEKYITSLLKGEKNIDKKDEFIKEIQHEFQKEPQKGEPQYLILLDGLNEVATGNSNGYSIRTILENEIANDLQNYRNVRFIITSRSNSGQIKGIKKIDISGVSKSCIEGYLRTEEKKGTVGKGITNQVLKNKELLNCLRIPLFLNMFGVISGDTAITTRGEILGNFFQKKRSSLYLNKIEGERINGFILDFIIPEIAWEMTLNDSFAISFAKIQEIIEKILTNKEESSALNEFSQKCFVLDESPSYLCSLLLSMYDERQRTKGIIDIMISSLAIIYVDDGEYKFKHHHFRDYFAAFHIISEMKLGVYLFYEFGDEGIYLNNIKKYRLHTNTIQFISESIGLHHSNPQYIPYQKWTMREWNQNNEVVPKLLNVFRGHFDDNVGWGLWNIVLILNSSGMGLLGIDLSDLNLKNINFNGILCGISRDFPENSTRFDNSLIDLNYFLPISHHEVVVDVKYSDNGQYILTLSDTKIIIWNSTYDYVNSHGMGKKIRKAIFSRDSNFIICCTEDSQVIVWDLWKDEEYMVVDNYGEICDICTEDTNNSVYVAFKNGDIRKLHLQSRRMLGRMLRVKETIKQILFNKKYGQIVVRTENGNVLYGNDLQSKFIKLPFTNVKLMTQSQDGERFGIITSEGCIRVGNLYQEQLNEIICDCKNITAIQLSPDGGYLALVENGFSLQILNLETCQFKRTLQSAREITSLSFSNDNKYVITAAGDSFVKVWEIKSNVGVCIRPLGDMADWVRNAYYSPDGNYIATSSIDSTGKIWDAKRKVMTNLLFGHEDRVTSISYDHTGEKVVTTSDDCSAKIWYVRKSGCLKTLKGNENSVHNATFDKEDKRLVTVSWDKTGTIWELETEEEPKKLIGHRAPVLTVLFNTSYKDLITSSNDNSAIVWDAKTGKKKNLCVKHEDRLNSAAFSPDDKYIITSSFDKTAKIWKSDNGNFVKTLKGHDDSVRSALFSPDGNYIVTVSRDNTGKLWDGHTFLWHKDLIGHTFFVRSAMFDEESQKVVTASYDGSIREWNLEGDCTNIISSIPGLFICGCDFRNLNPKCVITSEQKEIFKTHGAIVN